MQLSCLSKLFQGQMSFSSRCSSFTPKNTKIFLGIINGLKQMSITSNALMKSMTQNMVHCLWIELRNCELTGSVAFSLKASH